MKFAEQNFHFPIEGWNLYGTQNFEILISQLSFKYKGAVEKCYQLCSMVKFFEQNWTKSFLAYFPYNPKVKLRLEVLFKKFHPRINRTTLFSTKPYRLNTIFRPWILFLERISKTFSRGVPLETWISKFWVFYFVSGPQVTRQKCLQICSRMQFAEQNFHVSIMSKNLYGRYP
jgi:hypothetical protein